jgi:hypothetical protein
MNVPRAAHAVLNVSPKHPVPRELKSYNEAESTAQVADAGMSGDRELLDMEGQRFAAGASRLLEVCSCFGRRNKKTDYYRSRNFNCQHHWYWYTIQYTIQKAKIALAPPNISKLVSAT